jgi:dienelactone hydrolase
VTPDGPGPFPTAILFHGCGGKRPSLGEWAQSFREAGFASVIVDSFAGRGLDAAAVCGGRRLLPSERAGDVLVSLGDVRRLPFVDPQRIVLMGWSHGSVAIMDLLVMDPPHEIPPNLERESTGPRSGARGSGQNLDGVAGAVLFYPYCGIGSRSYHGAWAWRAPNLFLLGGADTTAPSGPCLEVAAALEADGHPVEAHVYPQAGHGFDHRDHAPGSPTGYDSAASADAGQRVRALLLSVARAPLR